MREAKVPRLIFVSSGSVYGISDLKEVNEDAPLVPISCYNNTMMVGERVIQSCADNLNVQIVRPATVAVFPKNNGLT